MICTFAKVGLTLALTYGGGVHCLLLADTPARDLDILLDRECPDCVICLGDLDYSFLRPLDGFEGLKLGVYGNHCHPGGLEEAGITNLHGRVVQAGGLSFLGIEGCPYYKPSGAIMHTEEEIETFLRVSPHVDCIVTHCPPYGVNDHPGDTAHIGWRCLRHYAETSPPRYLLYGHTYPNPEELITRVGATEIVYCYGSRMVDLVA